MREAGRPIPPPSRSTGKWTISAPDFLYRRLAERAQEEGISVETLALPLLAGSLGGSERGSDVAAGEPVDQDMQS